MSARTRSNGGPRGRVPVQPYFVQLFIRPVWYVAIAVTWGQQPTWYLMEILQMGTTNLSWRIQKYNRQLCWLYQGNVRDETWNLQSTVNSVELVSQKWLKYQYTVGKQGRSLQSFTTVPTLANVLSKICICVKWIYPVVYIAVIVLLLLFFSVDYGYWYLSSFCFRSHLRCPSRTWRAWNSCLTLVLAWWCVALTLCSGSTNCSLRFAPPPLGFVCSAFWLSTVIWTLFWVGTREL